MSSYLSTHVFMTGNLGSGVQKQLGFLATNLSNSVSRLTKNSIFKILDEFCPFFVIITQEKMDCCTKLISLRPYLFRS